MTSSIKVFVLLMFSSVFSASSQTWEIGVTAGGMAYLGDLNQNNLRKFNHPAAGGVIKRNFDSNWSLKLALLKGKISADESISPYQQERDRNLSFFSPLTEGSLQVEFNFFDYGFDYSQKRFTPFLSAGVSLAVFNPQTNYNGTNYELKYYNTEGQESYNTTTYAIPIAAGLKYNFGRYFNIIGEIGFRDTSTDYLDDVSGYYANSAALQGNSTQITALRIALSDRSVNKIGVPGTQRGDFRKKDSYLFAGITLTYTFVSQKCAF
ncbi:type IX secretion system protein PorG [Pedobacter cryophilus]|uniref:DUF6089 domain-containing protein n=1 Tax=Pedobacter cryophilus TaxID=2571271 RepID=A0A4U1BZ67_9SPHI|nr:DUF6089 family protein [Pedobacter cryophilus]TKB96983.1 hypothetical protein FA046_13005 [Pedobacter cryophilus]